MIVGPAIGNAINKTSGEALSGADAMISAYLPAAEIFLVGAIVALLALAVVPIIRKAQSSAADKK